VGLGGGDGHSSGTPVAERLVRPTRAAARRPARHRRIAPWCLPLLLGLAPGGVFPAAAVTGSAVRSYRTVSPLPPARHAGDGLGGVLSVALSLGSPPPGVTRHRTSVEPGLSSPRPGARSGHPAVWRLQIWAALPLLSKVTAAQHRGQGLVEIPTAAANSFLTLPANSGLTRRVVLPALASIPVWQAM
jgi:hypothetical protein